MTQTNLTPAEPTKEPAPENTQENIPETAPVKEAAAEPSVDLKGSIAQLTAALERQEKVQKRLLLHGRIRTGVTCLLVVLLLCLLPMLFAAQRTVLQAEKLLISVQQTFDSMDLKATLDSVDTLLADSIQLVGDGTGFIGESSEKMGGMIEQAQLAVENLASMDIDALNESIESLQKITSAMSRFLRIG